jgi:hypothetical protein
MNATTLAPVASIPSPKTARRPEWRRFTQFDWYAYAGAESFENGDQPWIAEIDVDGESALAIVDRTGVQINVFPATDDDTDITYVASDFNTVLGFGTNTSRVELERVGFTQV